MMSCLGKLHAYVSSLRDPRTTNWSFHTDARFVFPVLLGYVYLVKVGGPRWMQNREPFDVRRAILVYNAATAVVNGYFCVQYLRHSFLSGGYSLFCQGIDYESGVEEVHTATILELNWWYTWVRIADFADTFFFLARKKYSQISYLHVVHHFLVVFNSWLFISFGSDGQPLLGLCMNPFVHVVMYSYYFLAALGPSVRKYLSWKRYLTQLQIAQFVVLTAHMAIPLFYDCGYPRPLALIGAAQGLLGLALFINFYAKTYVSPSKRLGKNSRQKVKDL